MLKQTLIAIVVLIILITSQMVWFDQLWKLNMSQFQKEATEKISDCFSFQSLSANISKDNPDGIKIEEEEDSLTKKKGITPAYKIKKEDYGTGNTLGNIVENILINTALEQNVLKLSSIDSIFRKSFTRLNEISYYSFVLKKNEKVIDSIYYGKKTGFSSMTINLPLGDKNIYHFSGYLKVKPSAQIRTMLFSIGITSVAIILVAIFMVFQLIQLRKKTLQLQWREKAVSGIVHDLKSPLAYVYTMLGFFEKGEKDSVKQQSLDIAKTRVKFLSNKIELLLSALKANNNNLIMNLAPYDFNRRCNEIMEELKTIYKDKKIEYSVMAPSDFIINVDNTYFEGCIRNVLDNAIKYSTTEVKIDISATIKNNKIYLTFKDNGIGIPKNMRKKVFKEFYRQSETGEIKGHGVGLSFTKQIIEAHKGKIYIEKQKEGEKGTTFVIELKASSPAP